MKLKIFLALVSFNCIYAFDSIFDYVVPWQNLLPRSSLLTVNSQEPLSLSQPAAAKRTFLGDLCTDESDCSVVPLSSCLNAPDSTLEISICSCPETTVALGDIQCLPKVGLGENCLINEQCEGENVACYEGSCACEPFFYVADEVGSCLKVASIGDECTDSVQCAAQDPNAVCDEISSRCTCATMLVPLGGGSCLSESSLTGTCTIDSQCQSSDLTCVRGQCVCANSLENLQDPSEAIVSGLQESGEEEFNCNPPLPPLRNCVDNEGCLAVWDNSECSDATVPPSCVCQAGFVLVDNIECLASVEMVNQGPCRVSEQCPGNSVCIGGECVAGKGQCVDSMSMLSLDLVEIGKDCVDNCQCAQNLAACIDNTDADTKTCGCADGKVLNQHNGNCEDNFVSFDQTLYVFFEKSCCYFEDGPWRIGQVGIHPKVPANNEIIFTLQAPAAFSIDQNGMISIPEGRQITVRQEMSVIMTAANDPSVSAKATVVIEPAPCCTRRTEIKLDRVINEVLLVDSDQGILEGCDSKGEPNAALNADDLLQAPISDLIGATSCELPEDVDIESVIVVSGNNLCEWHPGLQTLTWVGGEPSSAALAKGFVECVLGINVNPCNKLPPLKPLRVTVRIDVSQCGDTN